jgi:PKD domain
MSFHRSCRRGIAGLALFLATAALCAPAVAQLARNPGDAGADGDERRGRDDPAGRAEWNAMLRRDRDGRVLAENRLKALDAACQLPVDPSMAQAPAGSFTRSAVGPSVRSSYTFTGTAWQSLGPQPMQSKPSSHQNWGVVAGRVDAIAVHPTNPSIMLLGAATGGIWKSTDAGATWRPVSDTAPSLATSHIAFSPANPSIVFAATGEADKAAFEFTPSRSMGTYLGGGLLKSVDTGETWTRVDANLPANAILSRVAPHPTNPQLVVVGVYMFPVLSGDSGSAGGIYRSTDGGVSFTQTLSHRISDLVQDPNNADSLLLATGGCSNCGKSGIYGSSDFGQSWTPLYTYDAGVAIGNTKLGITRTNPAVVYASFLDDKNVHNGIYRSTDAGANWTKQSVEPTMCPAAASGTNQCSYDHWIAPDPVNPSTVYFGSIDLYKSTDGANTWTNILNVYGTGPIATTHPDQHVAAFGPGGMLFIGNDGGVYQSGNGGSSFSSLNATLNFSQFNGIAVHPTNVDFAIGGTQDNGNQRYTGTALWSDRTGGDGGFNLIRKNDPTQILAANYYAYMRFSSDTGNSFVYATSSLLMDSSGNPTETMSFYPPAVAASGAAASVFFGTNRVWANSTFGLDPAAWSARSSAKITNSYFTALDAPGGDPGPVWGGTTTGSVFFSADGGATFASRFTGLPAAPVTRITSITADGRSAYATFAGYLGSPSEHVFRTNDAGVTWTNVSSNLPDVPVLGFAVDPTDPSDLFLGTDVGVFRSTNGGASWVTFNAGLPNVPVYGLVFHPVTNDLWAATYGRGVWRVTNPISAGPVANFLFSPPSPLAGQSVQFTDTSTGGPASWSWDFGDAGVSTSQNPTHTFATAGSYPVSLIVSNSGGSNSTTKSVTVTFGGASSCVEDASTMCLVAGRYRVRSHWKNQYGGGAVSTLSKAKLTDVTGAFWIADSNTYEYLLRIMTGTNNGRAWIAIPTFTDVEFWIEVTDTRTGQSKEYHSLPGNQTLIYDPTFFVFP